MFPFTHLVGAWIIGLILQKISKIKVSRLGWGLLLFGGILPDIDYLFGVIFSTNIHRGFTHSLVFVLLSFFIFYLVLKIYNSQKESFFISLGVFVHIIMDMFYFPGVLLFWPFGTWFSFYGISNIINPTPLSEQPLLNMWLIILDIAIGIIWLGYLYIKGKVRFD